MGGFLVHKSCAKLNTMPAKWEWDDVRFFLAASREGSLSGAARALSVDHVTVGRRIVALEGRLGAKLLTRTPEGLAATSAGQAILKPASSRKPCDVSAPSFSKPATAANAPP